jgi:uncharacterized membrane protein YqaE (UPF0057 family)
MKNIFSLSVIALVAFAFTSCNMDLRVEKRRYNSGWYVHKSSTKETVSAAKEERSLACEETTLDSSITHLPAQTNDLPDSTDKRGDSVTANTRVEQTAKKKHVKTTVEPQNAPVKKVLEKVKRVLARDDENTTDDNFVLAIIFALLFPFIGVLIWEGEVTDHFWIALILTLLFGLPGMIYALYIICGNTRTFWLILLLGLLLYLLILALFLFLFFGLFGFFGGFGILFI